eukprot:TRINITY_DN29150_c0_g2_i4.p1 TRINITY_DN29150_c0_g2~~TRINITY_DN29150_c0_g2_i4.p1  ORF type:complete len:150 (-),score=21.02 TRINITY_DN29150_c0_g2_i4:83-532(-)
MLSLLEVVDGLPIFGLQGHGEALTSPALPVLAKHWRRAPSWCVSNCDWVRHAGPMLRELGFGVLHEDVLRAVPGSSAAFAATSPAFSAITSTMEPSAVPKRQAHRSEASDADLVCLQWSLPSNSSYLHDANGWLPWDRCLDIMHAVNVG